MSLLGDVVGGLLGGGGNASPMQGVLMNLLGGHSYEVSPVNWKIHHSVQSFSAGDGCNAGRQRHPGQPLGRGGGVKSRSPLAGARSAGLEAAASPKHNRGCRSIAIEPVGRSAPSVIQDQVQPSRAYGTVPHQLISGRRS